MFLIADASTPRAETFQVGRRLEPRDRLVLNAFAYGAQVHLEGNPAGALA
jgi:hypothetical protein